MLFEDRTREIIYKKHFYPGPTWKLEENFRQHLVDFREEHKKFDEFLIGLGEILKAENNDEYSNLIKFIDGKPRGNWVASKISMITVFIKLYNLCLSPKQAFEYIKECNDLYNEMCHCDYELTGSTELFVMEDCHLHKESKYLTFTVVQVAPRFSDPLKHIPVTITLTFRLREFEMITCTNDILSYFLGILKFETHSNSEKAMDALLLFDNYQNNRGLLKYIFMSGIIQLEEKGMIWEVSRKLDGHYIICNFETNLEIGTNETNKLSTKN